MLEDKISEKSFKKNKDKDFMPISMKDILSQKASSSKPLNIQDLQNELNETKHEIAQLKEEATQEIAKLRTRIESLN